MEFITKNNLSFLQGNIIKYVCRYKDKNGAEDLEKAKHYLDMLIEETSEDQDSVVSYGYQYTNILDLLDDKENVTVLSGEKHGMRCWRRYCEKKPNYDLVRIYVPDRILTVNNSFFNGFFRELYDDHRSRISEAVSLLSSQFVRDKFINWLKKVSYGELYPYTLDYEKEVLWKKKKE